jgi:hypothetical protein
MPGQDGNTYPQKSFVQTFAQFIATNPFAPLTMHRVLAMVTGSAFLFLFVIHIDN